MSKTALATRREVIRDLSRHMLEEAFFTALRRLHGASHGNIFSPDDLSVENCPQCDGLCFLTNHLSPEDAPAPRNMPTLQDYQELCAELYQFAGAHNAPKVWLDVLSRAAEGKKFNIEGLLPYAPEEENDGN